MQVSHRRKRRLFSPQYRRGVRRAAFCSSNRRIAIATTPCTICVNTSTNVSWSVRLRAFLVFLARIVTFVFLICAARKELKAGAKTKTQKTKFKKRKNKCTVLWYWSVSGCEGRGSTHYFWAVARFFRLQLILAVKANLSTYQCKTEPGIFLL